MHAGDEEELVGESEAVYAHDGTLLPIASSMVEQDPSSVMHHHHLTQQDEVLSSSSVEQNQHSASLILNSSVNLGNLRATA